MKTKIVLSGIRAISLNNAQKISTRGKFASKYKTKECVQFESLFSSKLRLYRSDLTKLNNYFIEKQHCLHMEYKFYFPTLTKSGVLSKSSSDVDNLVKITQDCLFKELVFNDAYITKIIAEKIHSEKPSIEIIVRILTQ